MKPRPILPPLPDLPPRACLWVAFSGGLDSTVLLHLLARSGAPGLRAVHVHHGLQAAADDWARHCRRVSRSLGVPLRVLRIAIDREHPDGPEGAARAARYEALANLLRDGDLLATAHHREDQAETVLLRALRGTGIDGIRGMPASRPLGRGRLWRPLLGIPRADLRRHAAEHGLHWIEDPHNRAPRYARSYLRTEVWPRLEAHWPQASASLARLAVHAADAQVLLSELAQADRQALGNGGVLSVPGLLALSPARRRNLLHHWLGGPGAAAIERIERELLRARPDAQPRLRLGARQLRRHRDALHLLPLTADPPGAPIPWVRGRALALPAGCGRLVAPRAPPGPLEIRFVEGGEKLKPACGGPTRTLRNLFQERGTPPWVRRRVPLIYEGGALAAVGDWFFSVPFAARGWVPRWESDWNGSAASRG